MVHVDISNIPPNEQPPLIKVQANGQTLHEFYEVRATFNPSDSFLSLPPQTIYTPVFTPLQDTSISCDIMVYDPSTQQSQTLSETYEYFLTVLAMGYNLFTNTFPLNLKLAETRWECIENGIVGKLKEDYLYPQYLFFDAGCGQTVLEFDQELPENWEQVYQKVANEPFEDPELDALLPDEVFQFEQAFTLDKQLETYIKNIQQYKETGIDDDYINSQIIPELIPYIEGQMPVEQLTVVDDAQEAVINQGMRMPSITADGGIIVNLGGGEFKRIPAQQICRSTL